MSSSSSSIVLTTTMNGAKSLKTSGDCIIDFFMMFSRNMDIKSINKYMKRCWVKDALKTIAIIFNGRDRINGKKEKKISNIAMLWLRKNKPETYKLNILKYIEKYGCWKDINYINYFSNSRRYRLSIIDNSFENNLIAEQLKKDKIDLENGKNISLCAKWAPTEKCRNDKKIGSVFDISNILYPNDINFKEKYRKEYITPLRKKINIVERKMCNNEWGNIEYDKVPAVASKRLKKAFMKHDNERYLKFLEDVKCGIKKINTTGILPHELVKHYLDNKNNDNKPDETIELMWNKIIEDVKNNGNLDGVMPVVDVSGSMYTNNNIPILVSISLGLLICNCNSGVFNRKVISFSRYPKLFEIKGNTLFEQVNELLKIDAGLDTDFEAVSDLIISHAKMYRIPQENMIKKIIVLSDMQFNAASSGSKNIETLHDFICNKYKEAQYLPPDFIYWNLNSYDQTLPVECNKEGTALISGFSEQLLKAIMKYDKITPEIIINDILLPYLNDIIINEDELNYNNFSDDEQEDNENNKNNEDNEDNEDNKNNEELNNIFLNKFNLDKDIIESESENEEEILHQVNNIL